MTDAASRTELTELESCVLGAVWLHGPCSAYAIRREFADSSSSHWSASSGSIYPVIKRLSQLKLIVAAAQASDGRGTRDLAITAEGRRVLELWIADLPEWTGKPTLDPIRTRMNFLSALKDRRAQADFVDRAEQATRVQIDALKRRLDRLRETSEIEYLATLGSLYEIHARLRWLRIVRRQLRDDVQSASRFN